MGKFIGTECRLGRNYLMGTGFYFGVRKMQNWIQVVIAQPPNCTLWNGYFMWCEFHVNKWNRKVGGWITNVARERPRHSLTVSWAEGMADILVEIKGHTHSPYRARWGRTWMWGRQRCRLLFFHVTPAKDSHCSSLFSTWPIVSLLKC